MEIKLTGSGIVMHTNYASMRVTGQKAVLDQIVGITRQQGCFAEFYAGICSS